MADRSRALSTPHRFNSLVAAAEVITSASVRSGTSSKLGKALDWQEKAWEYYDQVGEFRFGVSWLANAMSRVNLVAAQPPEQVGDEPVPLGGDELTPAQQRASEMVEFIAGGAAGQGQLLAGFGRLLPVAGFAWLVAEPVDGVSDTYDTWTVYDVSSLSAEEAGDSVTYKVRTGDGSQSWRPLPTTSLIVKCWRPHPRRRWEPDAPVRGVLNVLDQIDLLTAHITATGRSRLAGAGLLAIPAEAEFPQPPSANTQDTDAGETEEPKDPFDHFVDQLIEAMTVPIRDRDNAAAVVPLAVQVPGEYVDKIKHLSFSTPFDQHALELLVESIKRLALGMDMPPEVLTGMAGVNHWTAWQVEETAITLHIEPMAEIVCQALTEGYLRPALEAEGLDVDTAMVWYDTSDLQVPPDRSGNVVEAYDRLEASGAALRRYLGLEDGDQPDDDEKRQRAIYALATALSQPDLLREIEWLDLEGVELPTGGDGSGSDGSPAPAPPDSEGDQAPPPVEDRPSGDRAAADVDQLALVWCDNIVQRAMEKAGARLKSRMGRRTTGGAATITTERPSHELHLDYDPTLYCDLDFLLDGAWDRVPEIAERIGWPAEGLTTQLDLYARSLLASKHAHTIERLAFALSVED